MEETISTPTENVVEQTPLETTTETQPVEEQTPANVEQEPAENTQEVAENVEGEQTPKEPVIDWEKRAKDNQAEFTRVSQELAELKKQIADNKPKIVQNGRINPEYERNYKWQVDSEEYLAYDNLARQLEPEQRAVVENLLREANGLYDPNNTRAYESKMAQVKDYFRSDYVEKIALHKKDQLSRMQSEFDKAITAEKHDRANKVAQSIEAVPELNELVAPESENFSQDVFDIVKAIFDYTGNLNVESTTKAVQKIKELGVKEYIAKQQAEQVKAKANVPVGNSVVQEKSTGLPTRDELLANPHKYKDAVKKFGMEKVDAVIMKG